MGNSKILQLPLVPEDFLFFCCPECNTKSREKSEFVRHAYDHIFSPNDVKKKDIDSTNFKDEIANHDEEVYMEDNFLKNEVESEDIDPQDVFSQSPPSNLSQKKEENYQVEMKEELCQNERVNSTIVNIIKNEESDFICSHCSASFKRKETLERHVLKQHDEKKFTCKSCDKKFAFAKELLNHVAKTKHDGSAIISSYASYQCWECSESPFSTLRLKKHMLEKHGHDKCFKCPLCDEVFKKYIYLKKHKDQVHDKLPPPTILCSSCPFTTNTNSNLRRHMIRNHNIAEKIVCSYCPKTFTYNNDLQKHILNAHTRKVHPCSECKELFETKKLLYDHLIDVHGKQAFPCKECESRYTTKSGLDGHVNDVHRKNITFKCSVCPVVYSSNKNLKRHFQRNHETVKPFVCDICKKTFSICSDLTSHMKERHSTARKS